MGGGCLRQNEAAGESLPADMGQKNTAGFTPAVGIQGIGTARRTALINSSRRRVKNDLGFVDVKYHWVVPPFLERFLQRADFMPPARACQGFFK